jgi:hypothetical protein
MEVQYFHQRYIVSLSTIIIERRKYMNNFYQNPCRKEQKHVHEIVGSVQIAERGEDPHNHRFATVSGEAIPTTCGKNHVHQVRFRTDFYEGHYHEFFGTTCPAVEVGDRHVHFLESVTTENDGHKHCFRVATLIEDPIGEDAKHF